MKKVLHIGSNSVHLSSFIANMSSFPLEQYLLSEDACEFAHLTHSYRVNFRSANPLHLFHNYLAVSRLLKALQPDFIHIHQVNRLAYFVSRAASKQGIPVITTAWGSDVLLVPKQSAFYRFLVGKSLKRSRIVTADSSEMISAMQALCPSSNKYHWLQYGIDPVQTIATKEKIIFSNRLHRPLYRIDQIIRYFAEFVKMHTDWKLVIAGSGTETESLKALAATILPAENYEFVGWLNSEENFVWYSKASMYVSLPTSDGTSVSLLEALSAGCLPIVSDLPVSYEWIEHQRNGVIEHAPSNPFEIGLPLLQTNFAQANKKRIDELASKAVTRNQFYALYLRLTSSHE